MAKTLANKAAAGVLGRVRALADNLWWAWDGDAQRLFGSMDPALFAATNQNPVKTLRMLSALDVRLVLSGHAHRSYSRIGLGGGPLIVQCATTTSVRLRGEPNAYNRISVGGSGDIAVQVRVWDGDGWTVQGNAESD